MLLVPVCKGQEYLFARYTPADGLINSRVRFLYQDSKGRLYASTFGGLSVYDGSRFINYTTENGLSTSLINDVVEMGDDSLWIVPNADALNVLVHGAIRPFRTDDGMYPVTNQLIRCSDGNLYALSDNGLFRFEGRRFVRISLTTTGGMEAGPYLVRGVESGGRLFMVTDPELKSYPGTASLLIYDPARHQLLDAGRPDYFYSIARSPSGEVLVATANGVRMVDGQGLRAGRIRLLRPPSPFTAADSIRCNYLLFDHDRNLWLSTGKQIIKIDRAGGRMVIGPDAGLPAGTTSSIFEDRENNIWVTNAQNGIARLVSQDVRCYEQPEGGITVNDLAATPGSDSVWGYDFTSHDLVLLAGGERKVFHGVGGFPAAGHILFGQGPAGREAYLTSGNTIYRLNFLSHDRYRAVAAYRDTGEVDGRLCIDRLGRLILTSHRLVVFASGSILQAKLSNLCDQAAVDKYNRIWVTTRSKDLSLFVIDTPAGGPRLRLLARWPLIQPGSPRSIAVDSSGNLWIGTREHGLYHLMVNGLRLSDCTQLTVKNGLSEDFIYSLYCDADNTLWVGTPTGLDKIRRIGGRYTVSHITPGRQLFHSINKITASADGTHWILVSGGYLQILRSVEQGNNYRPPLLFSRVLVGNEPVTGLPPGILELGPDQNAVSFDIGVPGFSDENQVRFSYQLEGSTDERWSTPSTQSTINFINLPSGRYTLRAKAQFLSGRYPDEAAAYAFVIRPHWWQTTGFRAAALILLAALTVWGIRTYIRRRLEAQRIALERRQAIEKERTRIATDMHDDLGAGLSRIKFLSETIGIKREQHLPIEEELSGIRKYSGEMIDKIGEIVWALNEKNDLLSDLLSYTRAYTAAYLAEAGIRVKIEMPEEFPSLFVSGEFRRNIYLVIKEALHNIVKHASAGEVYMQVEVGKNLVITLRDDGAGFDPENIRPYGNGLHNMAKRIRDLGGELRIRTGKGTTVELSVPL